VLSDANFDRYGIPPRRFGQILRSNNKVNAYAIFIGSLEDQADQLIKELPMGHAFACMDTTSLKINKNVLIIDYTVINWRITLLK
jgi:hypothetical protein